MSYSFAVIISYLEAAFLALHPHELALIGAVYFLSLYLFFASLAWFMAKLINRPIETSIIKPAQMRTELFDSLRSVLIFGISLVIPWAMITFNLAAFPNKMSVVTILTECLMLIVWHDIHFYVIHWLLHKQLKKTHTAHHLSVTATPFTAYSMGVGEAVLLSSVIPIAMLFYDFSLFSLGFLTIWSVAINALIHSNCDLSPNASKHSLLGIIKHHQSHHTNANGNYSFFFTQLDSCFYTRQK